jgi:hypothetical protein
MLHCPRLRPGVQSTGPGDTATAAFLLDRRNAPGDDESPDGFRFATAAGGLCSRRNGGLFRWLRLWTFGDRRAIPVHALLAAVGMTVAQLPAAEPAKAGSK